MTPRPAGELDSLCAFVETSRGPCLVLDGAFRVASANRAFCEAFGLPAGQAEGRLVFDLDGGRWAFPGLRGLLDAALGGEVTDFEVEHDFGPIGIRSLRINARRVSRDGAAPGEEHVLMAIEDVTDRLQARELSQLLAAIVDSSDDAIVGKSFEGIITSWNRGAERMFGYTAEEIVGRQISTLTPPVEPDRWAGILEQSGCEQAVPGEVPDHFETRRLTKDGRILDLAVTVSPIRDVSQDRRIAEAVREAQKQRQKVIDAVPALICYLDREGRYRLANEAYRTWYGLDPRAMLGRTVREVLGDREYEVTRPRIERTMSGEPQKFEQDLPADGGIRTIQMTYTPDLDASGRVVGCVVLGNDISERKRMEETLRGGEERWRGLFEGMVEGFFLGELVGDPAAGEPLDVRLIEINPAFGKLTGLDVASTVGKTIREVVPEIADDVIQTYAEVVETGEPAHFEDFVPALGDRWFEARARRIEGRRLSVLFMDVTDRKRSEGERLEVQRKQEALIQLADCLRDLKEVGAITSAAMEIVGRTLGVSRAGYGQVDLSQATVRILDDWTDGRAKSLAGRHPLSDYGGTLRDRLIQGQAIAVADVATDPITAGEAGRWASIDVAAVIMVPLMEEGSLAAVLFIQSSTPRAWAAEDLAFVREAADRIWATVERARVVHDLRASEERFRQITNVAPQVLWTAGPDGQLDYLSDQHYESTGTERLPGLAVDWARVIHPDDLELTYRAWDLALTTGDHYEVSLRIWNQQSGRHRWHLTRAVPIRDDRGTITKWLGANTDIDDQKRAEAAITAARNEAEAANQMKDDFLATLSHELRTPLNAIIGWAKVLRSGRADAEDFADGLAAIERNSEAQSQLIDDLLDTSRIISGKLRLELQPVDLAEVIDAAIASVGLAAAAKEIRIVRTLDPEVGRVSGDFARLQQIIWNLLSNALKFTPQRGQIGVALVRVDSHLEVSVSDSGTGIPAEFLPHVFDRFRQADSTTTRLHGGLGLGLAIVKQLAELHGGEVRATSAGEGLGSTFTVSLPIMPVNAETTGRSAPAEVVAKDDLWQGGKLAGLKVMVVDDEPDARQLLRRVLEGCLAEVTEASSAEDALSNLESSVPDLIISDIGMPVQDGYEFIRRVRTLHTAKDLPAVALTAFARAEDRKRALLAGFQRHIAKPVDPAQLTAVVAGLAGRTG
ncbi:PAS domain S-box protein [Isosphaeraceae bacterium EP7]